MSSPIHTQKLSKAFRRNDAVRNLDLDVPAGSIYGLIGPNGAGKTTTIKLLMNILRPSAGSAAVLGVDSRRLAPAQLAASATSPKTRKCPTK